MSSVYVYIYRERIEIFLFIIQLPKTIDISLFYAQFSPQGW
jgi:hypothetical protein